MTGVPHGLELAFLSNLAYFRELTRESGGTVLDQNGSTCYASPHPMPFLVSAAYRTDPAMAPALVLAQAQTFFAPLGRPAILTALAGRDDDLIAHAVDAGFVDAGSEPLQVLPRQRLDGYDVAGVQFRTVTDESGVADYISVARASHASYGFPDDLFPTLFARPATMLTPHVQAFVGYAGTAPVAVGTLYLTHGVAYVGWISVIPSERKRGLGAGVTAAVVNRGLELGASCATLVASPMGAALYRRLGFADVGALVNLKVVAAG